jgi:hypothetical protein
MQKISPLPTSLARNVLYCHIQSRYDALFQLKLIFEPDIVVYHFDVYREVFYSSPGSYKYHDWQQIVHAIQLLSAAMRNQALSFYPTKRFLNY